jgi:alpha-glucosidase
MAAHPQKVLDNPALDVIKSIPAVWDETIVLPGSAIGQLAVFARRTGGTWFLAVMCGPQAKTIQVPLSFLGDDPYKASLVRDNKEKADAVVCEEATVRRRDTLTIEMNDGGGFVGRFSK